MNYGRAVLEDGFWRITGEPHVLMRAKRVLACVSKRSLDVRISHTPEHCRDLEWFCERYPLDVKPLEALKAAANRHRESVILLRDILTGHSAPRRFDLALPPRAYQAQAAELLLASGSLLLADDLGLGKTCSAIATFCDPRTLPALVVAPAHLVRQWKREIARFAPHLQIHELKKATPYPLPREVVFGEEHGPDVIVSSYHKIAGWADVLGAYCRSVVFDEVHELRHSNSQKYRAADAIAGRLAFRLGLSATPIFNYGGEIRSVLEVLRPGALGTSEEFTTAWCCWGDKIRDPKALGAFLRDEGLLLRRTRSDVGAELPELTRVVEEVEADPQELDAIEGTAIQLARIIVGEVSLDRDEAFRASGELDWRLRQATGLAKAVHVASFVQMLVASGEKIVLAGWHHAVYDVWKRVLDRAEIKSVRYTGEESASQKDAAFKEFTEGDAQVVILSLRTGAGLDGLQGAASVVVFGEIDWSPAVHDQVIGRLHRPGQRNAVVAYFLVAATGSDPVMAEVLGIKREQLVGIRDAAAADEQPVSAGADRGRIRRLAEEFLERRGIAPASAKQEIPA